MLTTHNKDISEVMTKSRNEILPSRDFDYRFDNLETFIDNKPIELHRYAEQENNKNNYFCETNQSQSPSDTVKDIVIDNGVCKNG